MQRRKGGIVTDQIWVKIDAPDSHVVSLSFHLDAAVSGHSLD